MLPRVGTGSVPEGGLSRPAAARRLLGPALATVLLTDLAGGLLDVAAGRSSPTSAWSSSATRCAPWPMIAFQVGTFLLIRHGRSGIARVAAIAMALACAISVASGFFDGQLGRGDLGAGERGLQVWLLAATGVLGIAALASFALPREAAGQKANRRRSEANQADAGTRPHSWQSRAASSAWEDASSVSPTAAAASAKKASTGPSGAPVPADTARPDQPDISG